MLVWRVCGWSYRSAMSDNRLQTTALSDNRRRQRLPVLRTLRGADHWVFILSGKSVNGGGIGEVRRASPAFLKGLQEARIRPAFFVIALDNDPAPGHPQHLQVSGLASSLSGYLPSAEEAYKMWMLPASVYHKMLCRSGPSRGIRTAC